MEMWLAITLITCIIATLLLKVYVSLKNKNSLKNSLPPGPRSIPIISSIKWLRKSTIEVEASLKALHPKFGPIITLSAASRPFIFISTPPLVYEALIQKGITFASRPNALLTAKILTNNQLNISLANYGSNWRIFRRNLISNIVNPSLFELEITDEDHTKRKLNEEELVTLCSEFLTAGADTTSTALQWIMANLVKYPTIQDTLYQAIKEVIGTEAKEVKEEDMSKIAYLKAVILEGLRRHPPSHFSLPHAVSEEVTLGGYNVPKNAIIFFTLTEMCHDPKVWEDPMEFKPERFMENEKDIDITGSREIKMMPFGVGRRICPAFRLAILHLEYFVANLVWKFEWITPNGYQVDLSEKQEFTVVMKHPLHAYLRHRQIN
ncbi:cytochrome P450 89A2-like [Silene latifolia]|uniref:cytochrome P450 89A2-like n=1 Tax=Silene latifolia TaxID=37657 RepID=UPI003D78847B